MALGLTMGSIPAALAAFARDLHAAAPPTDAVGVLNFALTLEYLENEFYSQGPGTTGLLSGVDQTVFSQIQKHEAAHVAFITQAINSIGGTPAEMPTFGFTGGGGSGTGPYADVFSNVETFRAVAQALEDTDVRAYKGQAPALLAAPDALTAALRIHSVEARHAARVRLLRGEKPYLVGATTTVPGADPVYAGEENQMQGTATLTQPSPEVVQRAFDEPLTFEQVRDIANQFIESPKIS